MHGENDPPQDERDVVEDLDGISETSGDDAQRAAESDDRAARADGADPLEGLVARVRADGPAVAFATAVIRAAARQRADDPAAYVALRGEFKRGKGFPLTRWEKELDACERELRREARARAEREARERAAASRETLARARAEASEATARARAAAAADVAAHYAEHVGDDDAAVRMVMEPGRVTLERPVKGGRVETRTLADFSCVIVSDVHEVDLPGARPRRTFDLAVMLPSDEAPRVAEGVSTEEFESMRWPMGRFGTRAVVRDTGRRDDLRVAIQSMSRPTEVHRYRFTGWAPHRGEMVYLHHGGAIGADGPVPGVRSEAAGTVDRFDFGDLALDPARGVAAVLELLAVEPATVMVPLVLASFRAVMGPSRLTVHVSGRTELGKSTLVGLAQALFGRTFHGGALPASWADKSTENGVLHMLTHAGDAAVAVDELLFRGGPADVHIAQRFDTVTRAHFNRAAPLKLQRDGSPRPSLATRGTILSTGESPPRGHSTRNRVVDVELEARPTPDLEFLLRRAAAGELARGMASFVQWYAPRVAGNLPRLDALERAAATRWGLGSGTRAAALFGALALGAELLLAWLSEAGVDAPTVGDHEARAREALHAVARAHRLGVEAEDPARRFIPLLRDAVSAGEAHLKALRPDGRTDAPADAEAWGWRTDGSDGPKHQGKCVGWVREGEVFVDPGVALDVVRTRGVRAGYPVPADERALARDLHAAGLLARTDLDKARARFTARSPRVYGKQHDVLVFTLETFGVVASEAGRSPGLDAGDSAPDDFPM
jgi:hypothetical protein